MKTKKVIALLLIATILTAFIPNLVSNAAENPGIGYYVSGTKATTKTANVGDVISVDVMYENGLAEYQGLAFTIIYDSDKLEPIPDGTDPSSNTKNPIWSAGKSVSIEFGSMSYGYQSTPPGEIYFMAGDMFGSDLPISGKIATIKFNVIKGGETKISTSTMRLEKDSGTTVAKNYNLSKTLTITAPIPLEKIEVTPAKSTLNKGESVKLTATKSPADTTDKTAVTWKSSNTAVTTVDASGNVKAVGAGTATITATCSGKTATATIEVKNPITGLNISDKTATLKRGQTKTLTATVVPADTTDDKTITWTSSDETVATVAGGVVTAKGLGTATITATCGNYNAKCDVTVNAPLEKITINLPTVGIDRNETAQLEVTNTPIDTTDKVTITWTSSKPDVATVDSNGLVTGVSLGETVITATAKVGSKTFTATSKVTVNVHIESIEITNGNLTLYKDQTETLNVKYSPDKFAEQKTLTWTSSDEKIAKVETDKSGNTVVKAIAPGEATITATTLNGKTDSIKVTVPVVKADTLTINKNKTSIEKGANETLTAKVLPDNTTDDKTVTWKSSDEKIATVDSNGKVTAVAPGTATITATVDNDRLKDECDVTVTCALKSISLNKDNVELVVGGTDNETLTVSKNPTDADSSLDDVKWTSANEKVATVENGKITAVGPGKTVVTAELDGKKVTANVTVEVALTSVEIENSTTPLDLTKNQTSELKVNKTPSNATIIPTAKWTSSDETVASVDQNGKVTAVKEGKATITVDYGNNITSSRDVNVKEIKSDSVTIDQKIEKINKNKVQKLTASLEPLDSTDEITWESSDPTIATVDPDGTLHTLKSGKVTITAKSSNGKTDEMEIEVEEVNVESVKAVLTKDKVEEGQKTQVNVETNPTESTDTLKKTYKSSNPSVATVDENGKVTTKKAGDVVISVSVEAIKDDGTSKTFDSEVKLTVTAKPAAVNNAAAAVAGGSATSSGVATATTALTTSPHTGDMNVVALATLMIVSLAGMIITVKKK